VRRRVLDLVDEAMSAGARLRRCCELLDLDPRTVQRWRSCPEDGRATATRRRPPNQLSEEERAEVRRVACSPRFRELSPKQIVACLADEGTYIASESSLYRVLRASALQRHRSAARPATYHRPNELVATGPNQVWSWDITYLRGPVKRLFFYLYVVIDVWSRKIVAAEVHLVESGALAARLVQRAVLEAGSPQGLVLHSDRGGPMKSAPLLALLEHLAVQPSYSRPRVSDDNPYSESLFRTLKYRPEYPSKPFACIQEAQAWVSRFVAWYNRQHRHSAIGWVTPQQRHTGEDLALLERRRLLYERARAAHPERWSRSPRSWNRPLEVPLNPSQETRLRIAT
jgi:transposase InsO family protein